MQALLYYITIPWLYLLSYLPLGLLYVLSDVLYFLAYYVIGYRKKVVMQNLAKAFPDKSEAERQLIAKGFYRYLCDQLLESLKTLTISERTLRKRISIEGLDIFERYYAQNQSVVVMMGHFGNWEYARARFAIEPVHQLAIIYQPLKNKYFDKLMRKARSRFNSILYARKETLRCVIRDKEKVTATIFLADQKAHRMTGHWMTWLNQDTAVMTGGGKIAAKLNYPVIFVSSRRLKRGKYCIHMEELIATPKDYTAEAISELFMQRLAEELAQQPETWLWSHRRWKHKRPA